MVSSKNATSPVLEAAFGTRDLTCLSQPPKIHAPHLNESQVAAIEFAMAQNELAIIHGYEQR
jgi:hypothetical protein